MYERSELRSWCVLHDGCVENVALVSSYLCFYSCTCRLRRLRRLRLVLSARTHKQTERERVRKSRAHKQQQQHHLPSANGSFVTLSRVDDLPLLVVGFSLCSANKFCSWQGMKLMVPRFVVGGGGGAADGDGGGCLLHMLGLLLLVLLLALLCFLLH